MDLVFRSRNGKITEHQREHMEEKLSKLERYFDQIDSATVEVSAEHQRQAGEMHRVQVTLVGNRGVILRAEEQASDLYAAVDRVQDVLQRQLKRYKDKHWRRGRLRRQGMDNDIEYAATTTAEPQTLQDAEDEAPAIIRTKEFTLRPMFADDAVEQMELLGHNFFVFHDAETTRVSVLYRRRDGNYGLIVPQAE